MRDFRDAKAMAHTLRAALAAKGLDITVSQSLELVAALFGVADWNTLAAAIRREAAAPRAESRRRQATEHPLELSRAVGRVLAQAVAAAGARDHEYTTLEHLLLALIDDAEAATVMKACKVDLGVLKQDVVRFIDDELGTLATERDGGSPPTPALQRVVQRALRDAHDLSRDAATGADLLVAMLEETESPAVWLLGEQEMTRQDATNFVLHGIFKAREDPAP
jgi:hypothetical protein